MPLSPPSAQRTPQHLRHVHYRSFLRADGLWDIEGELLDTKAVDTPHPTGPGVRKAGEPIHHMHIRATIDTQLVVHAIEASLQAHPVQGCPGALQAMQRMVGCSMARGWRRSIDTHLAGMAGCTHLRELLSNMATAAFQSIPQAFASAPGQPPAFLGRCTGWDWSGPGVATHFPQFIHWEGAAPAAPGTARAVPAPGPAQPD